MTELPLAELERRGSVALDQWRGLALLFVLINHGFYFTDRVNGLGRVGVNLFFFISGILVFRSLARSRASDDWARATSFWWRRLKRLYPALLAYTGAMLGITWVLSRIPAFKEIADFPAYLRSMPSALAYTVDYTGAVISLGHLWSLGCEMQFYLLAPLLWIMAGKGIRRFAVFSMVLAILISLGVAQPFLGKWKYHFEFAVWPMMLGFFCEYKRHWIDRLPKAVVSYFLWGSIAIGAASMGCMLFGMEMKIVVIAIGALLLVPCFLAYSQGRPIPGKAGRAAEWLGVRTYSIYLWQQPFTICNFLPSVLHPFGALVAIAIGAVWFRLFEFPFLSGGRRKRECIRGMA
jgi:peptidoglycan/LPS O-acetylase OafA/YrhL